MERADYIASELAKWKEKYEIGFEQEFDVKLMIELQYQIISTPKEHIKSISELVHTKNRIMQDLKLKPKSSYLNKLNKMDKILIKTEGSKQYKIISNLIELLVPDNRKTRLLTTGSRFRVVTNDGVQIDVINTESDANRGLRSNYTLNIGQIQEERFNLYK